MVTGPEPEQVEEGRVLHLCHCGEPTEFPGILHEGEVPLEESEEAGGELHRRRSPGKTEKIKNFSKTENKTRERLRLLTFFFFRVQCSVTIHTGEQGTRGDEELLPTLLFTNVGDTTNDI